MLVHGRQRERVVLTPRLDKPGVNLSQQLLPYELLIGCFFKRIQHFLSGSHVEDSTHPEHHFAVLQQWHQDFHGGLQVREWTYIRYGNDFDELDLREVLCREVLDERVVIWELHVCVCVLLSWAPGYCERAAAPARGVFAEVNVEVEIYCFHDIRFGRWTMAREALAYLHV